jgi:hypothetical protein
MRDERTARREVYYQSSPSALLTAEEDRFRPDLWFRGSRTWGVARSVSNGYV